MATTKVATSPMKVAQIPKPGADFQIVKREIPTPDAGKVRVKVQACGVCHSDVLTKDGLWPGIQYPRVPGHEVVGIIDEVGAGVSEWTMGQRVGVGWHGGHDGTCIACRRGDFGNCRNMKILRRQKSVGFRPMSGAERCAGCRAGRPACGGRACWARKGIRRVGTHRVVEQLRLWRSSSRNCSMLPAHVTKMPGSAVVVKTGSGQNAHPCRPSIHAGSREVRSAGPCRDGKWSNCEQKHAFGTIATRTAEMRSINGVKSYIYKTATVV